MYSYVEKFLSFVGIASLLVAAFNFLDAKQTPLLLRHIETQLIYSPTAYASTRLNVEGSDRSISDREVYLSRVSIWNSGSRAIKSEDIRTPITISADNKDDILHFSDLGGTSQPVQGSSVSKSDGVLEARWFLLDPGYSMHIAVLHTGKKVTINGRFDNTISFRDYRRTSTIQLLFIIVAGIAFFVGANYVMDKAINMRFGFFIFIAVATSFALAIVYIYIILSPVIGDMRAPHILS